MRQGEWQGVGGKAGLLPGLQLPCPSLITGYPLAGERVRCRWMSQEAKEPGAEIGGQVDTGGGLIIQKPRALPPPGMLGWM